MTVRRSVPRGDEVTWELRAELRRVDLALVAVLAERHDLVERLWDHKRAVGRPLEDRRQEARVLAAARKNARRRGLSPKHVEEILRAVIAEGKRRASAAPRSRRPSPRPGPRKEVRPPG